MSSLQRGNHYIFCLSISVVPTIILPIAPDDQNRAWGPSMCRQTTSTRLKYTTHRYVSLYPTSCLSQPLELGIELDHPVYVSPLLCVSPKSVIEENRLRMVLNVCIQKIRAKIEYRKKLNIYRPPWLVLFPCLVQGYPLDHPMMRQTVLIDAVSL